jgi:hypothetical protein
MIGSYPLAGIFFFDRRSRTLNKMQFLGPAKSIIHDGLNFDGMGDSSASEYRFNPNSRMMPGLILMR